MIDKPNQLGTNLEKTVDNLNNIPAMSEEGKSPDSHQQEEKSLPEVQGNTNISEEELKGEDSMKVSESTIELTQEQPQLLEVIETEKEASTIAPAPSEQLTQEESAQAIEALQAEVSNLTKLLDTQREDISNLSRQLDIQTEENQSLKAQSIRIAADFENFRRRTLKEKEELEQQVQKKTINELLPVIDNFERARTQIKPSNDGEMSIHKSYQGVYKSLVDSLKKLGVSAMRPEGQPFDPNYHEAMLREATNEYPEGTVIEQMVRGYLLNDQVLRHAMVKVAAPLEDKQEAETANNQESSEAKNS